MNMMLLNSRGRKRQMNDVKYLFVDGAYLRKALQKISEEFFKGETIEVEPAGLFRGYLKSFYYDCLPARIQGETEGNYVARVKPQLDFFQRLRAHKGVHVIEGVVKGEKLRRQKKIDVSIAVDMLSHAYRRNMDQATLLAGDLDFKPLIDALVQAGMFVSVWYEESSASRELVYAADNRIQLNIQSVYNLMGGDLKSKYPEPQHGSRLRVEKNIQPRVEGLNERYSLKLYMYAEDDTYEIVSRSKVESAYEGYLSHPNKGFLLKYADHMWSKCKWEDVT
jgi:uncharacterized LabA/DUF88 family protein